MHLRFGHLSTPRLYKEEEEWRLKRMTKTKVHGGKYVSLGD